MSIIYTVACLLGNNVKPYFFCLLSTKMIVSVDAKNSATIIDTQIPSTPINKGRMNTAATWNTNVLQIDIKADIKPLLSEVNNADPNTENPAMK